METSIKAYSGIQKLFTEEENLEFSPFLVGLGKVFEKEINSSIVNLIRNRSGIEMPDYYNKFKSNINVKVHYNYNGNERYIDFNKEYDSRYFPPLLGQSEIGISNYVNTNGLLLPYWDNLAEWSNFLDTFRAIRLIRNKVAHPEIINKVTFFEMKRRLEEFAFDQLFQIKEDLKNKNISLANFENKTITNY